MRAVFTMSLSHQTGSKKWTCIFLFRFLELIFIAIQILHKWLKYNENHSWGFMKLKWSFTSFGDIMVQSRKAVVCLYELLYGMKKMFHRTHLNSSVRGKHCSFAHLFPWLTFIYPRHRKAVIPKCLSRSFHDYLRYSVTSDLRMLDLILLQCIRHLGSLPPRTSW